MFKSTHAISHVFQSFIYPTWIQGADAGSLVARWAAVWRVERSILHWGNVSSQLHLISPGCPQPNSALIVQKVALKTVHPSIQHGYMQRSGSISSKVKFMPYVGFVHCMDACRHIIHTCT